MIFNTNFLVQSRHRSTAAPCTPSPARWLRSCRRLPSVFRWLAVASYVAVQEPSTRGRGSTRIHQSGQEQQCAAQLMRHNGQYLNRGFVGFLNGVATHFYIFSVSQVFALVNRHLLIEEWINIYSSGASINANSILCSHGRVLSWRCGGYGSVCDSDVFSPLHYVCYGCISCYHIIWKRFIANKVLHNYEAQDWHFEAIHNLVQVASHKMKIQLSRKKLNIVEEVCATNFMYAQFIDDKHKTAKIKWVIWAEYYRNC